MLEWFICFKALSKANAETINNATTSTMVSIGSDIGIARGQGYDGARSMFGAYYRMITKILEVNTLALYRHCHSHCLNPVLVDACKSSLEVKRFFGNM